MVVEKKCTRILVTKKYACNRSKSSNKYMLAQEIKANSVLIKT